MIKLLALDLDGTLLNSQKKVSEGNKKALEANLLQGRIIVVPPIFSVKSKLYTLQTINARTRNSFLLLISRLFFNITCLTAEQLFPCHEQ